MDALFTVLHSNGATTFSEVMSNFPASIPSMLGAFVGLTPEDRRHLAEAVPILIKAATAKHKTDSANAKAAADADEPNGTPATEQKNEPNDKPTDV